MKYIVPSLIGTYPFLYETYHHPNVQEYLQDYIKKNSIDIVHIEPGYVYPSLPLDIPNLVVCEHNIEHKIYEGYSNSFPFLPAKLLLRRDVEKMKRFEQKIWKQACACIAVSDDDAQYMKDTAHVHPTIVPNGIDEEYFSFRPKNTIDKAFTALFIGDFRWVQNRDAATYLLQTIWPKTIESYPHARLTFVGREFPEQLKKYCDDRVTIANTVKDIRESVYGSDIVFAPIRIGGGTKYKILEGIAMGIPVITSIKGVEGMEEALKNAVYVAHSPQEWVSCVGSIITDSDTRKKKLREGRTYLTSRYSWNTIAKTQSQVWEHCYGTKKA
jgi:glycosyltransferase involved in cell wall biosynthesis